MKAKTFRAFLNKDKGLAAIEVTIDQRYASLEITDCYRKVSLDFNLNSSQDENISAADKKRVRAKLNKIREALDFLELGLLGDGN